MKNQNRLSLLPILLLSIILISCGQNGGALSGVDNSQGFDGVINVVCSGTDCELGLEGDQVAVEVEIIEEYTDSECIENISYELTENLTELSVQEECSAEFEVTVEDLDQLEDVSTVDGDTEFDLDSRSPIDGNDIATPVGSIFDGDLFEHNYFSEECSDNDDPVWGFVVEIPLGARVISMPNMNGFWNSNKISIATILLVNTEGVVIKRVEMQSGKDMNRKLVEVGSAEYLILGVKDDCSKKKQSIMNIKFLE